MSINALPSLYPSITALLFLDSTSNCLKLCFLPIIYIYIYIYIYMYVCMYSVSIPIIWALGRQKLCFYCLISNQFIENLNKQCWIYTYSCEPSVMLTFRAIQFLTASQVAWWQRIPLPMQEARVWSLGQENTLGKEMTTHSSILACEIPWTEERDKLQFMGLQRVGHDLATEHKVPTLSPFIQLDTHLLGNGVI